MMQRVTLSAAVVVTSTVVLAQTPAQPDWARLEAETMQHFQALVRFDTSDPPGHEQPAAAYLTQVLEKEGIRPRRLPSSRNGRTSSHG